MGRSAPPPVLLSAVCYFTGGSTAAAATRRRECSSYIGPWPRSPGQKHGPGQRVSDISPFKSGYLHLVLNFEQSAAAFTHTLCIQKLLLLTSLSTSHIMEHLEGVIDKPEKDMTPQELQLHYFKMHDYDGNNLLDGLELATAITHVHREVGVCGGVYICFCPFWWEHKASLP